MKLQLTIGTIVLTATGLFSGCGDMTTNANVNVRTNTNGMTNMGTNNATSNAVLVNANSSANANRWNNPNVTREEYDRNRADYEKDRGTSTIGTGANDSWLWFKTRTALATTSDLRESTINVDVSNEVITLKGTVATAAQKAKAQEVANGIEGKKSVVNQLVVAPEDSMTNTASNTKTTNRP